MFKRKNNQIEIENENINKTKTNPYLDAKRKWSFMLGDTVNQKKIWQFIASFSMIITLIAVCGMIYIGSQSKFVPYLVEVNKLGETVSVGMLNPTKNQNDNITKAQLASFISNSRSVTPDLALLRKNIFNVYSMLNSNDVATKKMDEWLGDGKLQHKAQNSIVTVEIKNVLKQTEDTWQVDWIEEETSLKGDLISPATPWRAILNVYHVVHTTEKDIIQNPTGLKVRTFSWQEQF